MGNASTSAAGAYIRFSFPAGHTAAKLHYDGDGTGVVRYSWDGGSTWETSLNLTTAGPASVSLVNVPSGAASLRIERVSGNVSLSGVYMTNSVDGVRVNGLGASGSNTTQWAAMTLATWAAQVATLGGHLTIGLLGTNDQSAATAAATVASNIKSLMDALRVADPDTDLLWVAPPENPKGLATAMSDYTAAARDYAVAGPWAFLDLQYAFGEHPDDYKNSSGRPWFRADDGHPDTGGAIANPDALLSLITPKN